VHAHPLCTLFAEPWMVDVEDDARSSSAEAKDMLSWEPGLSGYFRDMEEGLIHWLGTARSKARRSRRSSLAPARQAAQVELLLERTKGLPDPDEGKPGWEPKLTAAHQLAVAQRVEMRQLLEAAQQHAKEVLQPRSARTWLQTSAPLMQGENLGAAGGDVVDALRRFLELCERQATAEALPARSIEERTQAAAPEKEDAPVPRLLDREAAAAAALGLPEAEPTAAKGRKGRRAARQRVERGERAERPARVSRDDDAFSGDDREHGRDQGRDQGHGRPGPRASRRGGLRLTQRVPEQFESESYSPSLSDSRGYSYSSRERSPLERRGYVRDDSRRMPRRAGARCQRDSPSRSRRRPGSRVLEDIRRFVAVNRLDSRLEATLRDLPEGVAMRVMHQPTFELSGDVRNPAAIVDARIRKSKEIGGGPRSGPHPRGKGRGGRSRSGGDRGRGGEPRGGKGKGRGSGGPGRSPRGRRTDSRDGWRRPRRPQQERPGTGGRMSSGGDRDRLGHRDDLRADRSRDRPRGDRARDRERFREDFRDDWGQDRGARPQAHLPPPPPPPPAPDAEEDSGCERSEKPRDRSKGE